MMQRTSLALLTTCLLALAGCGGEEEETPLTPGTGGESAAAPEAPEAEVEEAEAAEAPEAPEAPEGPPEACARAIVVAWQGAFGASDEVTRSEEEARARAEELRQRLEQGADFAELARAESDAASSGPRGGLLGTYTYDDFPSIHEPIRDTVFDLGVNETSELVRARYGWVIARRCPVEKVHTRHILIRYAGAHNAGDDVTRSEAEARARAEELRAQLDEGADFAALAREHSEDGSAERGGDIGSVGRGRLEPEYEEAAFALEANAISPPVRTRVGYHIIQRLPDEE
jgi:peptidyl-prolyl cis-trans isomerase SurA